jgi:hypothetical protein
MFTRVDKQLPRLASDRTDDPIAVTPNDPRQNNPTSWFRIFALNSARMGMALQYQGVDTLSHDRMNI